MPTVAILSEPVEADKTTYRAVEGDRYAIKLAGIILHKPTDRFVQGVLQSLSAQTPRQIILHRAFNSLGLSEAYLFSEAA